MISFNILSMSIYTPLDTNFPMFESMLHVTRCQPLINSSTVFVFTAFTDCEKAFPSTHLSHLEVNLSQIWGIRRIFEDRDLFVTKNCFAERALCAGALS